MAKSRKPSVEKRGPYLVAALFCERIITDAQDGANSAIRIIDKTTIILDQATAPPDVPSEKKPLPVGMFGLISFKTGNSPGDHRIRIALVSPSGKTSPNAFDQIFAFPEEPYSGVNVRLQTTILVKKGGVFHMEVYLDEELVTRVPFEISVERIAMSQAEGAQRD